MYACIWKGLGYAPKYFHEIEIFNKTSVTILSQKQINLSLLIWEHFGLLTWRVWKWLLVLVPEIINAGYNKLESTVAIN